MSEEIRFCSQCGFQLAEVTGLLAREGTPDERLDHPSPLKRGLKQSLYMFLAAMTLVFILANAVDDPDFALTVIMLAFAAAVLRALYALTFQRGKSRRAAPAALAAPAAHALPPPPETLPRASTNPVAVPKRPFDMGEIAEPPSVTVHTTRHLEHEPPRDRQGR